MAAAVSLPQYPADPAGSADDRKRHRIQARLAQRRKNRRPHPVRPRCISIARLSKRELELGALLHPPLLKEEPVPDRPTTRGDCASVPRPCPFVSCRHNLYLDVSETNGTIKYNFPDIEPDEMPIESSCALDVAELGGLTLRATAELLNITRERVRQIQGKGQRKAKLHLRLIVGE